MSEKLNLPPIHKYSLTKLEKEIIKRIQDDYMTPVFIADVSVLADGHNQIFRFYCPYCRIYHNYVYSPDSLADNPISAVLHVKAICDNKNSPLLTTGYHLISKELAKYKLVGRRSPIGKNVIHL